MRTKFRVLNTRLKGLQFETDKDVIRVGRSRENDLVLRQKSVSRFHAEVVVRGSEVTVEDIGSRNRTDVDGEPVDRTHALREGSIASFGDVSLEVTFPDQEPAAADETEDTPAGGVEVAAVLETDEQEPVDDTQLAPQVSPAGVAAAPQTGLAPAGGTDGLPVPSEAAPLPAVQRKVDMEQAIWPALTLLLGLTAAALLISFFLRRGGGLDAPVMTLGAALRVGEEKVIQVRKGYVNAPEILHSDVIKVSRPLNLDVAVLLSGLKAGLTTVKLYSKTGRHIELHVHVLPRQKAEVDDVFVEVPRTNEERIALALEAMKRGELMEEQDNPFEATLQYKRALALLEPFAARPNREYNEAWRRYNAAKEVIEARYQGLMRQVGDFIKDGDKPMALERLGEIQGLIPDTRDVRRQNCDLLADLLERMIEAEKQHTRRGL